MNKQIGITLLMTALMIKFGYTLPPPAQAHVRVVGSVNLKYVSKLKEIVELNFTMGYHHNVGKPIITQALKSIATQYGLTLTSFTGEENGSAGNSIPAFTLDDLKKGQVIVANNISDFGNSTMGSAKQKAIQDAIETNGIGYLGIHASGDNKASGWRWYDTALHPVDFAGHLSRTEEAPIYKFIPQMEHVILNGIFKEGMTNQDVPNELDAGNNEVLTNTPTRMSTNEWYQYKRDITRDAAYKNKVTPLIMFDARNLSTLAMPASYKRKGGNLLTYLYKVGKGITSYMPSGHDAIDVAGFDGAVGDFNNYIANLLFFSSGYTITPCDTSCNGLQIIDAADHMTGKTFGVSPINNKPTAGTENFYFEEHRIHFSGKDFGAYQIRLLDLKGRVIDMEKGNGAVEYDYDQSKLKSGIYFVKAQFGKQKTQIKQYMVVNN